jgi:ABC-type antimicrobial peptide transport system permease subunit
MGFAVIAGCVLSVIGVFYPALVAARMQPVEAMRVEQ